MQVLDRYFRALTTHDWEGLAGCLAPDVRRTGPYLDVVHGREAYVEFLSRVVPALEGHQLQLSRVRGLEDGSALVELTETVERHGTATTFPEVLLFDFDAEGRILAVDIYLKEPPPKPQRKAR